MGALKPWHIAIFVVVLVLLFGAKRLPDAARSLGRSLRIIKAETKGLVDDDNNVAEKAEPQFSHQPLPPNAAQQGYPQQGYQQGYQQQPGQPYQQPQQPPAQPYVDPVQRTNDR
ncbi:Sec-independent protein translocase subunit TatA [Actinoplanes sp. NPDC049316]|uniref:Sec-independent protein translocase subunit TatA n=1 Tax=Actinoplanes sp. NPDC049316 TaxID=3154727 RepID=UPI0034178478